MSVPCPVQPRWPCSIPAVRLQQRQSYLHLKTWSTRRGLSKTTETRHNNRTNISTMSLSFLQHRLTAILKPDFFYNWLPVGQYRLFTGYRKASSSDDMACVGHKWTGQCRPPVYGRNSVVHKKSRGCSTTVYVTVTISIQCVKSCFK